jgi:hypothetical protein
MIYTTILSCKIGGQDLALMHKNSVSLTIRSSAKKLLPELRLSFVENAPMEQLYIRDNAPIELSIKVVDSTSKEVSETLYKFALFSFAKNGPTHVIMGIWNAPKYVYDTTTQCYDSTSTEAIKKIANQCGLTFWSNAACSDKTKWYGGAKTYGNVVHNIARHAFAGNTSAMAVGVTDTGTLKFVDVNNVPPKFNFLYGQVSNDKNTFTLQSAIPKKQSAFFNAHSGYSYALRSQDLDEKGTVYSKSVIKNIQNVNIDKKMVRVKTAASPIFVDDHQSIHQNYFKAEQQNLRALNAFTSNLECSTNEYTGISIFDGVDCQLQATENVGEIKQNWPYSGSYVVESKEIVVFSFRYSESFVLTRTGDA